MCTLGTEWQKAKVLTKFPNSSKSLFSNNLLEKDPFSFKKLKIKKVYIR